MQAIMGGEKVEAQPRCDGWSDLIEAGWQHSCKARQDVEGGLHKNEGSRLSKACDGLHHKREVDQGLSVSRRCGWACGRVGTRVREGAGPLA